MASTEEQKSNYRLPGNNTIQHAFKLSIVEDRPIMMDYWTASLEKKVVIGVKTNEGTKERLLVKSQEEYTSPISKIFKIDDEYIIMTENSIYLISKDVSTANINN
jgi:hypothetical protein